MTDMQEVETRSATDSFFFGSHGIIDTTLLAGMKVLRPM